jgi:CubicO group peptidase (beta-lactamase class C family)
VKFDRNASDAMGPHPSRRTVLTGAAALATALASPALAAGALEAATDYARAQKTTGFLVIQDGRTLVEENWPLPAGAARFRANFTYGANAQGALLEDVASQQKSFVSVLVQVAVDKGLIDVERPVASYVGEGWSKAAPDQEARIRVIDLLTMSSGLTTGFEYAAPPGSVFLYNTPVYAVTKKVLAAAARQPLDVITRAWLTGPAGMADTAWRQRPAAFARVGNPTGLVTSPRDAARLGQIVLGGGVAANGVRIVSETGAKAMLARSRTNPAYGRLWWLNGSDYTIEPLARRKDGPLIPAAPPDLVAALGALGRKLYVVPSRRVIVVRMGQETPDKDFDQQLWLRLAPALA